MSFQAQESVRVRETTTAAWPFWRTIPRFDREYGMGDFVRAAGSLVRAKEPVRGEFAELFGAAPFYFARSGRECLYLILKMLELRPQSRVGVPLYCCVSVFQAIAAAGHLPVFLDVDLNNYALDEEFLRENKDRIDALVVVHTFGYPANLERLRRCLAGRNVPVIEDCAHALLTEFGNSLAGTKSDAAFFSFAPHKPAAAGGGALLVVNNPELAPVAKRELGNLRSESLWAEIRHSLTCWARSVSYHRLAYGALLASPWGRLRDRERLTPTDDELAKIHQSWSPARIRSVDLQLVTRRIREFRAKMPALAENTEKLRNQVRGAALLMPQEPSYGKWNHFMVPVRYKSADARDSGRRFLVKRGVDTSPLYHNCVRNAQWFGYAGGCPQAELAGRTVCTVPNHPWLSDSEIAYIGESLRLSAEPQ